MAIIKQIDFDRSKEYVVDVSDNSDKTIYDLGLHEFMDVVIGAATYSVVRVSGGWIYTNYEIRNSTFVPYIEEFINVVKK